MLWDAWELLQFVLAWQHKRFQLRREAGLVLFQALAVAVLPPVQPVANAGLAAGLVPRAAVVECKR